jgi:hypothetical protein
MSDEMMPYVVRRGDYLAKLAWVHGFAVDEVWQHEKNQELAALRKDHNVLAPGDVLFIPAKRKDGLPIQKGVTNRYVATVPKVEVKLLLRRGRKVLRDEPYVVEGLQGDSASGATDGEGKLTLKVPVTVRELVVVLPEKKLRYPVLIGDLDPISEDSGVRQRLQNLNHLRVRRDADDQARGLSRAVRLFQAAGGIEETGELDDATRDALKHLHGR